MEILGEVQVLEVVDRVDGRQPRPEAHRHGEVHDVREFALGCPVRVLHRNRDGSAAGGELPQRAAAPGRFAKHSPPERHARLRNGDDLAGIGNVRAKPLLVALEDEEQVLVVPADLGDPAREADQHLPDAPGLGGGARVDAHA